MNVHLITPIVCIVCIFYTCVGGMKAVVWVMLDYFHCLSSTVAGLLIINNLVLLLSYADRCHSNSNNVWCNVVDLY